MHIIKVKKYIGSPQVQEERDLESLRRALIKESDLVKKGEIGKKIRSVKEGMVESGRYHYYGGEKVHIGDYSL